MLLRAARRAALAATSRGLVSASKQPLPTMEAIRSLSKPELEGVRLQLDRQLDGCPAQADRGAIQRLLGATPRAPVVLQIAPHSDSKEGPAWCAPAPE